MFIRKSVRILLPLLAVFLASSLRAEEMPELEDYQPPPLLFDDPPSVKPFLTLIEPPSQAEKKSAPIPPRKPVPPLRKKKAAVKADTPKPKKLTARKAVAVKSPAKPSKTQLEGEQRLINPNVKDILASIEGVKPAKTSSSGKISLSFLPRESILTLDMKNALLNEYVPKVKPGEARITIQAYTSPDSTGETGARRLSLARALEIRDFLIAAGINSTRIDIMPLGNQPESVAADRVDVVTVEAKP